MITAALKSESDIAESLLSPAALADCVSGIYIFHFCM
jgi:hypothetical protein